MCIEVIIGYLELKQEDEKDGEWMDTPHKTQNLLPVECKKYKLMMIIMLMG
jgi:hypothetical protein